MLSSLIVQVHGSFKRTVVFLKNLGISHSNHTLSYKHVSYSSFYCTVETTADIELSLVAQPAPVMSFETEIQ